MTLCSLTRNLFAKSAMWLGLTTYSLIGAANAATVRTTLAFDPVLGESIAYYVIDTQKNGGLWSPTKVTDCSLTQCRHSFDLQDNSNYVFRAFAVTTANEKSGFSEYLSYYVGAVTLGDTSPPQANLLSVSYSGDKSTVVWQVSDRSHFTGKCLEETVSGALLATIDGTVTHVHTSPFGVEKELTYVFTDVFGNSSTSKVTLHEMERLAGDAGTLESVSVDGETYTSLEAVAGSSVDTTAGFVLYAPVERPSSAYQDSSSRFVIDMLALNEGKKNVRLTLFDGLGHELSYMAVLPSGLRRTVIPLEFPFDASSYDTFDFTSLKERVKVEFDSVTDVGFGLSSSFLLSRLAVREAGVFGSGRFETAYSDAVFIDNHAGFVADPSLVTSVESVPDGLVLYMKFDSADKIWVNEVGPGAVNHNGKWVSDGLHGGAVSFNRDGYMEVPNFESLFPNGSYLPMTVALKLTKPGNNDTNVFLDTSYDTHETGNREGFALASFSNNNLKLLYEKNGVWTTIDTLCTLSKLPKTVVVSIDENGNYFASIDGIIKNTQSLGDGFGFNTGHNSLWIGQKGNGAVKDLGDILEIAVLNRAVEPLEARKIAERIARGESLIEESYKDKTGSSLFADIRVEEKFFPAGLMAYFPFNAPNLDEVVNGLQIVQTGGEWVPDLNGGLMQFTRDGKLEILDFNSLFSGSYKPLLMSMVLSKPVFGSTDVYLDTSFDTHETGAIGGFSFFSFSNNNLKFGYYSGNTWMNVDTGCAVTTNPKAFIFSLDDTGAFEAMVNGTIKGRGTITSAIPFNQYTSLWIGGKGNGSVGLNGNIDEVGFFNDKKSELGRLELSERTLDGRGYILSGTEGYSLYGVLSGRDGAISVPYTSLGDVDISFNLAGSYVDSIPADSSLDLVLFNTNDNSQQVRYSIPRSELRSGYNSFSLNLNTPDEIINGFSLTSSTIKNYRLTLPATSAFPNVPVIENAMIEFR